MQRSITPPRSRLMGLSCPLLVHGVNDEDRPQLNLLQCDLNCNCISEDLQLSHGECLAIRDTIR